MSIHQRHARNLTKSVHTRYGLPTYMQMCFFFFLCLSFCVPRCLKGTLINLALRNVSFIAFEAKRRMQGWPDGQKFRGNRCTASPKKHCICYGDVKRNISRSQWGEEVVINQVDNVVKRQALRFLRGCAYKQSVAA